MRKQIVLPAIGPSIGAEDSLRRVGEAVITIGFDFARAEILPVALDPRYTGDALFVGDRFEGLFRRLREALERVSAAARRLIAPILALEDTRNEKKLNEALRRTLGIDIASVMKREQIEGVIENAVTRNVSLIRSLGADVAKRIELAVLESATQGETSRALAARLAREFAISKRRARLIARDQLGKFSGELNKVRQEALGVTQYVWETSLDERVRGNPDGRYPNARPSHWHRHGKVYSWKKPPEDGHPGQPINCRCVARGVIEESTPIRRSRAASGFEAVEV